jgi:hypothetical protein
MLLRPHDAFLLARDFENFGWGANFLLTLLLSSTWFHEHVENLYWPMLAPMWKREEVCVTRLKVLLCMLCGSP